MVIILDLDRTLLDTDAFKRTLEESLVPLGVSPEQFRETYRATAGAQEGRYDYSPEAHARMLHKRYDVDEAALAAAFSGAFERLPDYLYPDAPPFLHLARERGCFVALLTLGNARFQGEKVRRLGIESYFDTLIFTAESKASMALDLPETPPRWAFVNDNPNEIRAFMTRYPESRHIRVKRPGGEIFSPDEAALAVPTYATLDEVAALLWP